MAEPARSNTDSAKVELDKAVADYVHSLREEHRMLVALKTHLYEGSWEPMLDDLRNRLAGKPYIFKLVHRIQDDIERIEQMRRLQHTTSIYLTEPVLRLAERLVGGGDEVHVVAPAADVDDPHRRAVDHHESVVALAPLVAVLAQNPGRILGRHRTLGDVDPK